MNRKIYATASAILVWTTVAYSQSGRADDKIAELEKEAAQLASQISCKGSYRVGEQIMGDRQSGITILDELEYHKDREFLHELIDRAYAIPLFQTEGAKNRAIQEFAEQEYKECKKLTARASEKRY